MKFSTRTSALVGESAHQLRSFGRGDVDRHRALVAVRAEVVRGVAVSRAVGSRRNGGPQPRVSSPPGCAGARRPLDLDHVGAEVGQGLRAPGAGEDARQVEDADAVEGHRRGSGGMAASLMVSDCRWRARIIAADAAARAPQPGAGGAAAALALVVARPPARRLFDWRESRPEGSGAR